MREYTVEVPGGWNNETHSEMIGTRVIPKMTTHAIDITASDVPLLVIKGENEQHVFPLCSVLHFRFKETQ